MASFSNTSNSMSTNSRSDNEILGNTTFGISEMDFSKTFSPVKSSIASNSPLQTSNSFKHFKKLKRKNTFFDSESQHKHKYSALPHSMKSSKTLFESNTVSNYKTKKHNFNQSNVANSYYDNLNNISNYSIESSFDTEFPGLKFIQLSSTNNDISMSPVSMEEGQHNISCATTKFPTVDNFITNDKQFQSLQSALSSSLDISRMDFNLVDLERKTNNELNLDEILSDCSLSDVLFLQKDGGHANSSSSLSSAAINTSRSIKLTPSELPVSDVSLENRDKSLQKLSNVIINFSNLGNDENEDETSQIEIDEQNRSIIKSFEVNQLNLLSNEVNSKESEELIPKLTLKNVLIDSVSSEQSEPHSNRLEIANTLQQNSKITSRTISKTNVNEKKLKESKRLRLKTLEKIPDVLKTKEKLDTINDKTSCSSSLVSKDIGLQYSIDENNCMVQLPNGAVVPSFLATLKPKNVSKLCVCGIAKEKIPEHWSQSFHDILHHYFYKLCFVGSLRKVDTVNVKHNDLSYKIVCVKRYDEENIKKTVHNVDDFVCLEYGIPKTNFHYFKHSTYLAVLPNLRVIGYLEVEPIQNANVLTRDEKYSENIMPVQFGVSKIWALIKYRDKNVDVNLLETFRVTEKLRKNDIAFSICGCPSVKFIKQYIGNENILAYN